MLEHRVEELSGEVKRTRMLHLERVVTCVSRASRDKNTPQRFCWRRQQPDFDQNAARVQDEFADRP